jgi:hypothetical protein
MVDGLGAWTGGGDTGDNGAAKGIGPLEGMNWHTSQGRRNWVLMRRFSNKRTRPKQSSSSLSRQGGRWAQGLKFSSGVRGSFVQLGMDFKCELDGWVDDGLCEAW